MTTSPPIFIGNSKDQQDDLNALADMAITSEVRSRLGIKKRRNWEYQNAVYEAYSKKLPIRFILLVGKRVDIEDAADDSSQVKFRELDTEPWYVHTFDTDTGVFKIIRGIAPPPALSIDPFEGLLDPGLDPKFQSLIEDMDETERETLIKARVGQGPFRDALISRWKGCSVTGCASLACLIASHIKPWSQCVTPAERLSAANGLLLTPNLDKLFDRGFITLMRSFEFASVHNYR